MKRILVFTISLLVTVGASAQWDEEYRMEIGGGMGLVSYLGDFNGNLAAHQQPMASLVAKRVFNPYMALAANVSYGKLKGNAKDVTTFYPDFKDRLYTFSHPLIDVGLRYEYNFWAYGTGKDYRGARRLAPFVFVGLGATYADTAQGGVLAMNLPMGAGIKYKATSRVNIVMDWAVHFSGSDKLDGVKDPYYIKSTGAFKNKDCYSTWQLTVTYSFMAKCRTCNNDRDD
ncbi:MAG: DUF6089 family protein [Prevotellaceae bacterium]|nr:DUF6089 family protein [Prevotella sp.]MDD7258010.1 DUF6089 family protein [Prevotellaceae bacterium]MDY6130516.1 DUF6089 family protein [Prevotella sp.]